MAVFANDDMVMDRDAKRKSRVAYIPGNRDILPARGAVAAGVVVDEDDRC